MIVSREPSIFYFGTPVALISTRQPDGSGESRAHVLHLLAGLVPCHRALRADGGLGGYRWGLDRRRALLAAEKQAS